MSFSSDDDPTILPEAGAGAAADDAPRLNPGRIIGAYRIERLSGTWLVPR